MKTCTVIAATLILSLTSSVHAAESDGWTNFTVESFQKVAPSDGNAAFSPYSLAGALRLLVPATEGSTRDKLVEVLKSEDSGAPMFKEAQFLHTGAIWMDHSIQPKDPFRYAIRDMHAYMAALDFTKSAEATKAINEWADGATMGLIPKIVEPADLAGVQIVLADAVAIKAKWLTGGGEFKEQKLLFHGAKQAARGPFLTAPLKQRTYLKADKMQMLEIAMAGEEVVFGMIVPDAGENFSKWKAQLTAEKIRHWNQQAAPKSLLIHFPLLLVRSKFDLMGLLDSLGLAALFQAGSQLPGITANPPLHLGWAKQDVFFSADKEGVKAAAVTTIAGFGSAMARPPLEITVDRPFLYYLTDRDHRHVLFIGQKTEP